MAKEPSRPVSVPQPVPMMKPTRRPKRRAIAPVGSVPAASPSTYIESGTVAKDMSGASVAPTMEPVAKITAEFAPVSACAAASRATLERARASSAVRSVAVTSILGVSPNHLARGYIDSRHYAEISRGFQPTAADAGHAHGAHWTERAPSRTSKPVHHGVPPSRNTARSLYHARRRQADPRRPR